MRTVPPSAQLLIAVGLSAALACLFVAVDAHHRRVARELAAQQAERAARLPFLDRHYPALYLDLRNANACSDRCRYVEAKR